MRARHVQMHSTYERPRRIGFLLLARAAVAIAPAFWLGAGKAPAAVADDVAIIVNPKTSVDNLTMGELRRIMLCDRQFWSPGDRITLLMRAPQAHDRDVILKRVYQMSEGQFRQYWIAKVFRADVPAGPKIVYSDESAAEVVAALPGAIAFVDASVAPRGVKVLRIDGRKPGDKGYSLQ